MTRNRFMNGILAAAALYAAGAVSADTRAVDFPATHDGMLILTADLHTHSVFSDGQVWPSVRVEEAHRDGLDLLAVTEHLEHQPHREDIPHPDRNRSYAVASEVLASRAYPDLQVVNGAEITRAMPPGHVNAVFLDDANALLTEEAAAAIRAANDQGAFVFWNHPNWLPQAPDGVARITPMHVELMRQGLLHGIEVANGTLDGHSEHALDIALEHGLTVLGTSDIHGLVDWTHAAGHGGHRPMTLVLAPEHGEAAIKQALFDGRTVAWAYDDLAGREEHVRAVVEACLSLRPTRYPEDRTVLPVVLSNACPLRFTLRNQGQPTFQNMSDLVIVPRNAEVTLQVRMAKRSQQVMLEFDVLNTQIGQRRNATITLRAAIP